jgi:hypothetical protein
MDPAALDLAPEITAARAEQLSCLARGDRETATLLMAWIDVLLDEWNRRQQWHTTARPPGRPDRAV